MGVFHFLNVKEGDCSIIQHPSGHVTVIDVSNAYKEDVEDANLRMAIQEMNLLLKQAGVSGNFNQKDNPVNPISYMKKAGISSVFRFVLSHTDMDHMDGIKAFFEEFSPDNFWDTANTCEKDFGDGGPYDEDDWLFYKALRDGYSLSGSKRLVLYSGAKGSYYNRNENGESGGDGLYVLSPTPELIKTANESDDYNDASYVILYRSHGGRILFTGDSHDATWEHLLENHADDIKDVDLLIAPHHGRKSDRSYDFLDVVNPSLTFFGNANSEHLAYSAWNYRGLPFITNNQANCMVVDTNVNPMNLYVTNENFAKKYYPNTYYDSQFKAYFCGSIADAKDLAA